MDFRRLFDLLLYQEAKYPQKKALSFKDGYRWTSFSTSQCIDIINKLSSGFLDLGLKKGEMVAILAHCGSPIWNFVDLSLQQIGVVVVPIHSVVTNEHLIYILKDSGSKICFASNKQMYDKVSAVKDSAVNLKEIYTFERLDDIPYWESLKTPPSEKHLAQFETFKAAIHEDDLATIIYTSGTTGQPKGVMLSHKNIISNIKATISLVPINCDKRVISFLPMSHIFERMVTYTYIAVGASIYYAERVEEATDLMKDIRPHYFTSVPRLLEKFYEKIVEKGNEKNVLFRKILSWSIKLGQRYTNDRKFNLCYWLQLKIANILVYRKWRKALGNKVQGIFVGAAALQPMLARLFSAAGIPVREGYGLTETSPIVSSNHFEPGLFRFGTVGLPVPGVEVKIYQPDESGEGEILVKGPNVMMGYYNRPEETAKVIQEDGWFHTGDIGKFVHKRFLQITDRKKDIFKTSSGKYVAPQVIENQLKTSAYIEQCMILGFKRPFVTALIVPSFAMLENWCKKNNVHWTAPRYMVLNPKVQTFFQSIIDDCNDRHSNHQKIKKFTLLYENWTIEKGEVTPTLKLSRPNILKHQEKNIEKMYK
ncbi:MAG: long-chain fatty acid--CoA ligase [Bacteroidetes bacterium]|nr:long-chain fatty acid--CoA ligase [Bacteroidota bacterium]